MPGVVKTIKIDRTHDGYANFLKLFHRETKILSQFTHPNICRFYEADLESNEPWFAMELYRGNNILQDLQQYGPAPEGIWFDRAKDILSGLEYAHSKNIMHGDLNPKNVIIDGRGAKLIDFGIARQIDAANPFISMVAFAPGWASPEHMLKKPAPASDIFVAASLLTFFGTGHYAFKPDQDGDFQNSILGDAPNYSGLSANQKLLLKGMHEKSREKRISASDALKLIEQLRPSASVRPVVKPVAKAKARPAPIAKKAVPKASLAEPAKAPEGIELLPNGARVVGWKEKVNENPVNTKTLLIVASILTLGLALIPYGVAKLFKRSTSHLDSKVRNHLGVSLFIYLLPYGLFPPFVTFWWGKRIGFSRLRISLWIQLFLTALLWIGAIAEASQGISGFRWFLIVSNVLASLRSFRVIVQKLSGDSLPKSKSTKPKKADSAPEVTGGHKSWEEVSSTFKSALVTRRGKRFIIEVLSAEYEGIYFQGYSEPDGARTIEAAADLSVKPELTEDQKVKMSLIGWDRPSEGLPNFIMFLEADESEDDDLADVFVKSLRDGYGLSIPKFRVMVKER